MQVFQAVVESTHPEQKRLEKLVLPIFSSFLSSLEGALLVLHRSVKNGGCSLEQYDHMEISISDHIVDAPRGGLSVMNWMQANVLILAPERVEWRSDDLCPAIRRASVGMVADPAFVVEKVSDLLIGKYGAE